MNINDRHIEVYDQYLNAELSKALRIAFETKLENDPKFREGFEQHASIRASIERGGRNQLKQDLRDLTLGLSLTDSIKYKPKSSSVGQWVIKGLIAVVIAGGLYYWFVTRGVEEPILPEEDKIEKVIPPIEEPPVDSIPPSQHKVIEEEVQVIHDTVYMFENEDGIIDAKEMNELIQQGSVTIDTIFETHIDTIYQYE